MPCNPLRDRPEIEITPEMIEAGIRAYDLYDSEDPYEWIVAAIYTAMEKARLREAGRAVA
jgi:hypothetical protein